MTIGWWNGLALQSALVVLSLYWVGRDYRKTGKLSTATAVVVWITYALHTGLAILAAWLAPLGRWPLPTWFTWALGAGLLLAGVAICGVAIYQFGSLARMSGTDAEGLVTGGIYALSRNPQNLGWLLALLGVCVMGRSTLASLLTLAFAAVIHGYIVILEEPYLERIHGDEYREYRRQAHRYLGGKTNHDGATP